VSTQNTSNGTSNGTAAPLRQKIAFATNLPTIVRLDSDGELSPGRFGDQYRYFLDGGKIMWVEPQVHDLIQRCGAVEGDDVCICKREVRNGNRKSMQWEVAKVMEEPAEGNPRPAQMPPPPRNAREEEADAEARAAGAARRIVDPPATRQNATPAPAEGSTAPQPLSLAQALMLALDAADAADRYAQAKLEWEHFSLDEDSIVKLAITAYIQSAGGKQVRP
jgi:hypothetical protein